MRRILYALAILSLLVPAFALAEDQPAGETPEVVVTPEVAPHANSLPPHNDDWGGPIPGETNWGFGQHPGEGGWAADVELGLELVMIFAILSTAEIDSFIEFR